MKNKILTRLIFVAVLLVVEHFGDLAVALDHLFWGRRIVAVKIVEEHGLDLGRLDRRILLLIAQTIREVEVVAHEHHDQNKQHDRASCSFESSHELTPSLLFSHLVTACLLPAIRSHQIPA